MRITRPTMLALAVLLLPTAGGTSEAVVEKAEKLAAESATQRERDPAAALAAAREALALTNEFVPTDFVGAGRKGEVVEDEFQAARDAYRRHRAVLYEAVGRALAAAGEPLAAGRYLRRSVRLDPQTPRGLALARVQIERGQGREALATIQRAISGLTSLTPETARLIEEAADVAGLPSAQAEIDRGRLSASLGGKVTLRDGPVTLPTGTRLSTTPVVRLDDALVNLIYEGEASCRTCSADLRELRRLVPDGVRVLILPEIADQDAALRQVIELYRHPWPILLGRDLPRQLQLEPRQVLLVARGGWTAAVMQAPFGPELTRALEALARTDVRETVPRAQWNHRPVDRSPLPSPPGLLDEGLAPGEDEPFPPEFEAAVSAYRAGRFAEAQKGLDALEARGDGWLLPPEARLNRALCLAGRGQRDAARRMLLRTGDSRFEEGVDLLLEQVAQSRTRE
jgi:tetratricopeptide (TPR) repeat protein